MKILVHHDGQQQGPFSFEEAREGLRCGRFLPSDLAWQEGAPGWVPLGALCEPATWQPETVSLPPPSLAGPTPGMAIASLVLGIASLVTCLSALFGIPGIICGHVALARIKQSGDRLQGSGMAIAGLIMSYIGTFALPIFLLPMLAAIAIPAFSAARQKAQANISLQEARKIVVACVAYSNDHGGKYPKELEELVPEYLQDRSRLFDPGQKGSQEIGYLYFGTGRMQSDPSNEILLESKASYGRNRVVGYMDGSAKLIPTSPAPASPRPDLPER